MVDQDLQVVEISLAIVTPWSLKNLGDVWMTAFLFRHDVILDPRAEEEGAEGDEVGLIKSDELCYLCIKLMLSRLKLKVSQGVLKLVSPAAKTESLAAAQRQPLSA